MSYSAGRGRGSRGASFGSDSRSRQAPGGYDDYDSGRGGRGSYRGRGRGSFNSRGGHVDRSRADADGDVVMGGFRGDHDHRGKNVPYGRPRTEGRFRPPTPPASIGLDEVLVTGMTKDINLDGLAIWLLRKLSDSQGRTLQIQSKEQREGGFVYKMANPVDARLLTQLSGVIFHGSKLTITQGRGPSHGPARPAVTDGRTSIISSFRQLIQSRYYPDQKFLDLSNIIGDPILVNAGVRRFETESKMGGVICKMIGELCPDVETMSLASNQLENLKPFSMLPSYVPKLTALSFQENLLRSLRDLEPLRGADLTVLRELLLTGNPLRDKELAKPGGDVVYRSDIKKLFPSIEVLDMEPVVGDITFAVDAMSMELPLSTKPGFFDSPATAAIVHDFLQTFLNLFDNNRSGLFDLYHDHSSFSVSLDTRPASTTRSSHPSSRDGPLFSAWKNFDHNLEKHKIPDKRISALAKGGANIINMFNQLPGLRHPAYPGPQYLVEGYQTGTGADLTLIVLVHGEFREVSSNTNRSFDRTFIIVAPAPGSRAAMAGMPYSVANDQLTVRSFAGNKAWAQLKDEASAQMSNAAPQASARPPQLPDLTVLKQLQLHHQLDDARQNQVIEFSTATGLNYQFSLQCLAETGWSAPAAMQAYHNVKGNIPPEAYQLG